MLDWEPDWAGLLSCKERVKVTAQETEVPTDIIRMHSLVLSIVLACGFVTLLECEGKSVNSESFLKAKLEGFHYTKDEMLEEEDEDRIVGGVQALSNEFPFQVSLQMKKTSDAVTYSHFCGGAILSNNVILTAGHCCVPGAASKMIVFTGSNDLDVGGKVYRIKQVVLHEAFNRQTLANDICVIKVSPSFVFNAATNQIVRNDNPTIPANLKSVTSGWGMTQENGNTTRFLMKGTVPTVPFDDCRKVYPGQQSASKFCAGNEGVTSCFGDSGGPLIYQNKLYGLVSGGVACGQRDIPVLYTNVAYYKDWINKHKDA